MKPGEEQKRGRPRAFDCDQALEQAMRLFWRHGYEATSLSDLTRVMGISPPSLYAAFGDKEKLFLAALERYRSSADTRTASILGASTAKAAVADLLADAARVLTSSTRPPGCMLILSAINGGPGSEPVRATVAGYRAENQAAIAARIARGREAGELPSQVTPETLAAFYMTVIEGMSLQARDGADKARLEAIAAAAMAAWPGRGRSSLVRAPARRSALARKRETRGRRSRR